MPPRLSRKLPLKWLLVVPFMVQILGVVTFVTGLSWQSGQRTVNSLVDQLGNEITTRVKQQIEAQLTGAETVVQLNIDSVQLGILDFDQPWVMGDYLIQQLNSFPQLTGITLVTETPNYVGSAKTSDGQRVLTLWDRARGGALDYRLDATGKPVGEPEAYPDYDHRQRPWYQDAVAAGEARWQAPFLTIHPMRLTISLEKPFYEEDTGGLIGVSGAELSLDSISRFLKTLQVGEQGQVFILEADPALLLVAAAEQLPYRLDSNNQPQRLQAIQSRDPLIAAIAARLQAGMATRPPLLGRQQFRLKLSGQQQIVQVVPMRLAENINWLVVVAVPESDFMAHLHHSRRLSLALAGLATLAALGIGMMTARCLVIPVQFLAQAAHQLADGKWQPQLIASRVQELSMLGQAFEEMALELQVAFDAMGYDLEHDALSDLLNRRGLQKAVEKAIAQPTHPLFGLFVFDINNFKLINDSFGHRLGDKLLISVATRLRQLVKQLPADRGAASRQISLARFGEDEFCLLINPIADEAQAEAIASYVLDGFRSPFLIDQREFFITSSMGVVLSSSGNEAPESLLRNADIALYAAKRSGKASYELFRGGMLAHAIDRLQVETDLRRALKQREFELRYQPIVEAATGAIRGCEALIRWQHPRYGLISSAQFIPIAEQSELILELGWWVMEAACCQLKQWQQEMSSAAGLVMSINVSGKQFYTADCLERIDHVLQVSGLNPRQVKLEITESLFLQTDKGIERKLQGIRERGLQLSLDDFGTGYSSMSYLSRFPITGFKIDRFFVQQLPADCVESAIAEAMVLLGHRLNLTIIAEGVETLAQLAWLKALKVPLIQGYLFSGPITAEAFGELLRQGAQISPQDLEELSP